MTPDGYGAPFVKATYNGIDIQGIIESFEYIGSEDDDDSAEFNIRLDDPKELDKPQYQEGVMWTVVWGYIKGPISHVRKIFCYEVKAEFSDNAILVTISFHEKGKSLKQRDTKNVYTDTNLLDVVHQTGKIHGITTKIMVKGPDGKPMQLLTTDEMAAELKGFAKQQAARDSVDKKLFGTTERELSDLIGDGNGPTVSFQDELAKRDLLRNLTLYPNLVQGNKTDRFFIDELGRRQAGGQYIFDTTDDEGVLKQRDFNQKPIRSWTYADSGGDLISFCPETKGSSKNGSAVNLGFDGWDRNNKTYWADDMNAAVPPELTADQKKTLSKYKKQLADLNSKIDGGVLHHDVLTHLAGNPMASDNTNRVISFSVPITVLDKRTALQNTVDYFEPKGNNKGFNDPTSNLNGTKNFADNMREEAELKMNPGSLDAVGDPTVFKGKIITVLGVSKKYSGNYYITKCTHKIGGDSKYTLLLELVRQGHNTKTNNTYNYIPGGLLNTEIGPAGANPATRIPMIIENP